MRTWAPLIAAAQQTIRDQIQAEHDEAAASLPNFMHNQFSAMVGLDEGEAQPLPHTIRVLAPSDGFLNTEVTMGLEGALVFPILVTTRAMTDEDQRDALTEMQGLVIDGLNRDLTLGGQAAPESPFLALGPIEVDGGEVRQVLTAQFFLRSS